MSHVTGAHQTKVGFNDGNGVIDALNYNNQPVNYRFNNGVPNQVSLVANPIEADFDMNAEHGLYAQDKWSVGRATIRRAQSRNSPHFGSAARGIADGGLQGRKCHHSGRAGGEDSSGEGSVAAGLIIST